MVELEWVGVALLELITFFVFQAADPDTGTLQSQ